MPVIAKIALTAAVAGTFSFSAYEVWKGPCAAPIQYTLGAFSADFKVSQADFLSAAAEAEAIWEKPAGKELFAYNATKGMPINLIYDERQKTADKNKTLEGKIDAASGTAAGIKAQLDKATADYARAKASYEAKAAAYKQAVAAYTKTSDYWNGRGGAPSSEYQKLVAQSAALKTQYASLDAERAQVNKLADASNALVAKYNGVIKNINSDVAVINQSADKEFEQGEYVYDDQGRRINIYEFTTRTMLVRVLAHEMGHALGMDHNTDTESIMHHLNKGKSVVASETDIAALKTVCKMK